MKILLTLLLFLASFFFHAFSASASTTSVYNFSWLDPDKEVYVLQNRKYRKANRLHAYAGGGKTLSGAFIDSTTLQGRVGYFATESLGFEFVYANNNGKENSTAQLLRDEGGARPFRRVIDDYMGGMILWSPFYSKINTFNKILYFDWILGLGFAKVQENNNKIEFQNQLLTAPATEERHNALMWNLGVKFFINYYASLRIDLTGTHFRAEGPQQDNPPKSWNDYIDLAVLLGISF